MNFAILDTETGGLQKLLHPLVSMSVLLADSKLNVVDRLHIKIHPPEGTLLEVTTSIDPTNRNPPVDHLIDADGRTYECSRNGNPLDPALADALRVTAGAARVNGFSWDVWKSSGVPLARADDTFKAWLTATGSPPTPVAHNASFDDGYVARYLPGTYASMRQPWECTMLLMRKWRKATGNAGQCRLADLAVLANTDPSTPAYQTLNTKTGTVMDNAHDALADTIMCHAGFVWLTTRLVALAGPSATHSAP